MSPSSQLPPIPPQPDDWPPRQRRGLHPTTVARIRRALTMWDSRVVDLDVVVERITELVQRDGEQWAADDNEEGGEQPDGGDEQ